MGEPIGVHGIKLSHELVQVDLRQDRTEPGGLEPLFALLGQHKINIPFVTQADGTAGAAAACCVEAEDFTAVRGLLRRNPDLEERLRITPALGSVTIFPHRSSLEVLGVVVELFGQRGFPVHAMGTSISALTITTEYAILDDVVDALLTVLKLPSNHAPFRPELKIKQV